MTCLEMIEKAQKGMEGTDAFAVGEQLKDICRDSTCAELVAKDLENKGMGLKDCAAKIKAYAYAHRKEGADFSFVPPQEAEEIIRKFYGLPDAQALPSEPPKAEPKGGFLNLEDFL